MKKMKRFFAALMAMAMVLGLSMTAFAAKKGDDGKYGTADDVGTITVKGIDYEESIKVTAYQIVEAKYDNNKGSFSGYAPIYGDASVTIEAETGDISVTEAQLASILKIVTDDSVTGLDMGYNETDKSYSCEVPVGAYMVVITGAENKVYSNVVVSAMYKNEQGGNAIDEGSVNVVEDGNAWVKVSENPSIDKIITNGDQDTDKGNTVNIGDTVAYQIDVKNIPYYGGAYPTFNVVDTLDTSLKLNADSVKLTIGEKEFSINDSNQIMDGNTVMGTYAYGEATQESGETLTFNFVVAPDRTYTLNDYQGQTLTITYSAVLTNDAKLSDSANENDVTLNYTHDSKVEGRDDHDDDETFTYSFDIDGQIDGSITEKIIAKVGESVVKGEREALEGAEFTLYKATKADGVWKKGDIYTNKSVTGETTFDGVITSTTADDNNLAVRGLQAGTYILQETKAPEGYSLNTHEFQIEIKVTLDNETGKLQNWSIEIDGVQTATFGVTTDGTEEKIVRTDYELDEEGNPKKDANGDFIYTDTVAIPNTRLVSLPSTGGIGTTIFTIAGCLIMVVAAALFFAGRKKSEAK